MSSESLSAASSAAKPPPAIEGDPLLGAQVSNKKGYSFSYPPSGKVLLVALAVVAVAVAILVTPGALPAALLLGSLAAIGLGAAAAGYGVYKGGQEAAKMGASLFKGKAAEPKSVPAALSPEIAAFSDKAVASNITSTTTKQELLNVNTSPETLVDKSGAILLNEKLEPITVMHQAYRDLFQSGGLIVDGVLIKCAAKKEASLPAQEKESTEQTEEREEANRNLEAGIKSETVLNHLNAINNFTKDEALTEKLLYFVHQGNTAPLTKTLESFNDEEIGMMDEGFIAAKNVGQYMYELEEQPNDIKITLRVPLRIIDINTEENTGLWGEITYTVPKESLQGTIEDMPDISTSIRYFPRTQFPGEPKTVPDDIEYLVASFNQDDMQYKLGANIKLTTASTSIESLPEIKLTND